MAKRPTREDLEREIARLRPFEELVYCWGSGAPSQSVPIESGEHRFDLCGAARKSGGVLLNRSGDLLGFACEVASKWIRSHDVYLQECARLVWREQEKALNRTAPATSNKERAKR